MSPAAAHRPSVAYGHIFKSMWEKIVHFKGYTSCNVKDVSQDVEIRRVTIPLDLAKLFGTETLLVKVSKAGSESGMLEYDPRKVTFSLVGLFFHSTSIL